jgi:phenylalanyl-tRNA synthetase beta chain
MTISYNWLSSYLTEIIEPERLSKILTAIGLEVESMEAYESIKGGLKGLTIGEVLECAKHPDADKLSVTKVSIGAVEPLQIVCGAPNVTVGQKVVVATVGATIYPATGEPLTMKKAKIRGVESFGMICAEDEIGMGNSHAGIMVLPATVTTGTPAAEYFSIYTDIIYEIGLTPNRMDAMCHLGVAKDVCAYLSHHNKKEAGVKSPFKNTFKVDHQGLQMEVVIENATACQRYAGVSIQGVTVKESPEWMQQKLRSIGVRPINNVVDVTNFILHETGQPLHAFDATAIAGKKVIVKNLPEGTEFITLDEKQRKLSADDIMICNAEAPMCIGGVFGGLHSSVTAATTNIFLESAWFNPVNIRKTSIAHGLRTDAATRFEKGVDISNSVHVLKRAAMLIKEVAGGEIASDVIDAYPSPKAKTAVALKYHYLKKLSGKNYHPDTVKNILSNLGFEIQKEGIDELWVNVPFSKPDISIAADLVEEIMRIDGLDNIDIPQTIAIAPAVETLAHEAAYKEKVAGYLVGLGYNEIFTNSITNSAYYSDDVLEHAVKMMNSLSAELNIMRPSMLETGLETVAYNLNRKNNDLLFFEFGKTYQVDSAGIYKEDNQLCLFVTGNKTRQAWNNKQQKIDFYFLKGVVEKIIQLTGLAVKEYSATAHNKLQNAVAVKVRNEDVAIAGMVNNKVSSRFDCKQPVFFAAIHWDKIMELNKKNSIAFKEIPKFPAVQRDLALVVDSSVAYQQIEKTTQSVKLNKLKAVHLFDVFESEKLGAGKKSMAVNFTFLDEEKTMTDGDIESMMSKLIVAFEKELGAEIRK